MLIDRISSIGRYNNKSKKVGCCEIIFIVFLCPKLTTNQMSEEKSGSPRNHVDLEATPRSARSDAEEFFEVACADGIKGGCQSPGSPLMKGMDLDLSLAPRKGDENSTHLQEGSLVVNFELPDGSYGESLFKLGQTVEVLKSFVESEYGIPMEKQTLYIGDMNMLNPLSLMDFGETKGADEILIKVDGPMPTCRK